MSGSPMSGWKIIGASVRGPDHEDNGLPCQDAFGHATTDRRLVAAVADGAGSARFSDHGSRLLCDTVVAALGQCDELLDPTAATVPEGWRSAVEGAVRAARDEVRALLCDQPAANPPASLDDYHATLIGAVAEPEGGFFFHIGDGTGAAVPDTADWRTCTLSPPENGSFANETYFFTQDTWRQHLRFTAFGPCALIMMVSDGAMPFTLAERLAGLEPRFLAPVTAFLDTAAPEAGGAALAATLDRPDARRISSDDKTLLWARPPTAA